MAKDRKSYLCPNCGYRSLQWLGRCPQCGEWDSFEEEISPSKRYEARGTVSPQSISMLDTTQEDRIQTKMEEVDRLLGGGIVKGSLILIGGDPGIGKSTLILQLLHSMARNGHPVLYVSGEESLTQITLRAQRLGAIEKGLYVMGVASVEEIFEAAEGLKPSCVAIDSVQTIYTESNPQIPGSIAQLREVTLRLLKISKEKNLAVLLVGHVTKEGVIAGPKMLEHMVDTVLYLEGEGYQPFRILRVQKNRFGPTFEMAVLEMREKGLWPVSNPSLLFLKERPKGSSGSCVTPYMAGTRPLLVEVQALATSGSQPMPRRTFLGVESQRVSLIAAVLEKRLGIQLSNKDLFINIVGGLRIQETAPDLAVAASIISSYWDHPIPEDVVIFGEVGLGGEVRSVSYPDQRVMEAKKLGFKTVILPKQNLLDLKEKKELFFVGITHLEELMGHLFKRTPKKMKS